MSEMQDCVDSLAPRKREVLVYAAKGFTNEEIGRLMNLSKFTVADYIKSAVKTLGVSSRIEAAVILAKCGAV